jgi:hypothetical protein
MKTVGNYVISIFTSFLLFETIQTNIEPQKCKLFNSNVQECSYSILKALKSSKQWALMHDWATSIVYACTVNP